MTIIQELTDEQVRMGFASSCIEAAAYRMGCSYLEMYRRMKRVNLIDDYIIYCYDTLHTMSRENVTLQTITCLENWERFNGIVGTVQKKGGDIC